MIGVRATLLTSVVSFLAVAPAAARAGDALKLGYVDVAKVLSNSKAGKAAKEQLEKQVKERQANVLTL